MQKIPFNYRPDIDGLRAVAVLSVLFFHLDYTFFSGGFIGVDVFFVISGHLISQIILQKIQNSTFSFKGFFINRVFRILPVLFTLIISSLIAGFFLLLNNEYKDLGEASLASLLFIPNILYWINTGYFEVEAASTPLLHLWSLGVEEQFYIFFPFVAFFLLTRLYNNKAFWITLLLILGSYSLNVIYTKLNITFSFYMLITRAWELLAGFLLTLVLQHIKSINKYLLEALSIIGLSFILIPVFAYDKNMFFPGHLALLPVSGSVLIIFSGSFEKETFIKKILSYKPMIFIGLISYSLYLWHWPIAVYLKMAISSEYISELIFVLSILVSIASYTFIEQPFRSKGKISISIYSRYSFLTLSGLVIVISSFIIISTQGLPQRLPAAVLKESNSESYLPENRHCHKAGFQKNQLKTYCQFGKQNKIPSFALLGDSHAEAFKYGLKLAAIDQGKSGIQFTRPGCRPIKGIDKIGRKRCLRFINAALNQIVDNTDIETVFLAGYWFRAYYGFAHNRKKVEYFDYESDSSSTGTSEDLFLRGFHRAINKLIKADKNIVVIGDTPILTFNPRTTFARNILLKKDHNLSGLFQQNVNHIIKEELSRYGNQVKYMPTEYIICPNNPCQLVKDNVLLFRDDDHISRNASALLAVYFKKYL